MYKYLYAIILAVLCSVLPARGQRTEDLAALASASFSEGSYAQALVYCSMYAAEHSGRLLLEKDIKLCLEYQRHFDAALQKGDDDLAELFRDRILALNPDDPKVSDRLASFRELLLERQPAPSPLPAAQGPSRKAAAPRPRHDFFNAEYSLVKDLEIGFSLNVSRIHFGVSAGYDIWKKQRALSPVVASNSYYWVRDEIIHPAHLMVHGGLFLGYVTLDCGAGLVSGKAMTALFHDSDHADNCSYHDHFDERNERLFMFRPEVKVHIPFSGSNRDSHLIVSFGYNFVKAAGSLEGITVSTGWGWAL